MSERKAKWKGMNWIRQRRRLSLYLRDGLACVYCGASPDSGARLTLDHVKPYSKGGTNDAPNLVTCCHRCNSSRGNRSLAAFAKTVAGAAGASAIVAHVRDCTKRPLPTDEAKQLIERRGSAAKALAHLSSPKPL